jgi:hypothetical protein
MDRTPKPAGVRQTMGTEVMSSAFLIPDPARGVRFGWEKDSVEEG